jgi:uncharacterized protein (TIGR03437 family)
MRFLAAAVIAAMIASFADGQSASAPSITSVSNSFSSSSTIAPNTWVSIYGTGLAPAGDVRVWKASDFVGGQMPTALDEVSVTLNGENAYVYYISPTQLNVLTPPDLAVGPVKVQVTANAQTSSMVSVWAQTYSVAFLTFGGGYATATHSNGSIAGPAALFPGASTPAQPGEEIVLYASGFGVTSSPVVKGSMVQSGTLPAMPVIQIGGANAQVLFAGLISPGLFQFNVVVPPKSANGDNAITAQYAGQTTQAGVLLNTEFVVISLSNIMISAGQSATLKWSATNAASCSASNGWAGSQPTAGSRTVSAPAPGYYTYTLTCTGPSQTSSQSAVLTAYGPAQTINYGASQASYHQGYQASFYVAPPNQITRLQTSMLVPPFPPVSTQAGAALFLWPGIDPSTNSVNFLPIDNGVLQPVLSWGPSCAPTSQPKPFSSWWISAQYVNTFGSAPGYSGCQSGPSMLVSPGDVLLIDMALNAATGVWLQTIIDANTDQTVTFSINLQGQGQNWVFFAIEQWYGETITTPLVFSNSTITFLSPDTANWCSTSQAANPNKYIMTPPTPQNGATQCFISSIVVTE